MVRTYFDNAGNFRCHRHRFIRRPRSIATRDAAFLHARRIPRRQAIIKRGDAVRQPLSCGVGGVWLTPAANARRIEWPYSTWPPEYREQLVYNKYKAARDTIEQYERSALRPTWIPREQHDSPTAALMLEKLIMHGLEVKQSADPDAWVVMMNQPFAGLAKELFEPQKYLVVIVVRWTSPAGRCPIKWAWRFTR